MASDDEDHGSPTDPEEKFDTIEQELRGDLAPTQSDGGVGRTPAMGPDVAHLATRRELGRGGMGKVFEAYETKLGRREAVKVIATSRVDESTRRLFRREAKITGRLEHPNIVPVHELGTDGSDRQYFTMKLVRGKRLDELMEQGAAPGYRGLADLLDVFLKVCDAVGFAHSRGVIHRDIKPENVMVGEFGEVYLMDWGIGMVYDEDRFQQGVPQEKLTELPREFESDENVRGTPGYLSPEQARGEKETMDPSSDIYALGIVLYEMVAGRNPFAGAGNPVLKLVSGDFEPPSEAAVGWVSPELERIVMRAMATEKIDRYDSVADLQADVRKFLRGELEFPVHEFAPGETIVRQGERADRLYVIDSGSCSVYVEAGGEREHVGQMGPGELFGETALLGDAERTATVVASEPTVVHAISREVLEHEVASLKPWLAKCLQGLARRFEQSEAKLREHLASD